MTQIWDIKAVDGKPERSRMRLTDGATCTEGAAVAKAGKAIMDGDIGDCDLIEVDSGSVTFVTGKLVVNEVETVLRSQPPAHPQVHG